MGDEICHLRATLESYEQERSRNYAVLDKLVHEGVIDNDGNLIPKD